MLAMRTFVKVFCFCFARAELQVSSAIPEVLGHYRSPGKYRHSWKSSVLRDHNRSSEFCRDQRSRNAKVGARQILAYCSPIKALSNQKFQELREHFDGRLRRSIACNDDVESSLIGCFEISSRPVSL